MKTKLTLLAVCISTGISSAYTLSVTNQSAFADPSLPLVDNAGTPLAFGIVGVGFFDSDDVVTGALDYTSLIAEFREYGSSVPYTQGAAPGLLNLLDPPSWNVSVPNGSTAPQVGKAIYTVFGNAATLADSTELAVWKSQGVFGTENDVGLGQAVVDLATGKGELLLGRDGGPVSYAGGTINYSSSIQLVAIPEPSTSLLAGLAGLALLARRRR